MKRKVNLLLAVSLMAIDGLMTALAFFLAYWLRLWINIPSPPVNIQPFPNYLGMMAIQVLTMLTVFFFSKLYHLKRGIPLLDEFSVIFAASSIGNIMSIAFNSLLFKNSPLELDYSRGMVVYAWLLTIVLVFLGRVFQNVVRFNLHSRGVAADRVLIVGTGEVGQIILHKIRHSPKLGYEVVGFIDGVSAQKEVMDIPILGDIDDIPSIIDTHEIDEVIIGLPESSRQEILTVISRCEREKVSIKVFPDVFQIMASEVSIGDLGGLPLLTIRDIALRGWKFTLKRAVDLIGSAVGLVVLSPLLMLVAFLIKLDSPGPVFYAQERMGLDAKPFWMLKFRSMLKDAESQTGPVWATKDDPRRTKIGAFIRRFSIDEFPQLINVLLGEMSLVGPRPERPVFVEQFRQSIPRYMDRHREKAGITGWAQVNGLRGDTSIIERTKYDLWYIENWSLLLDFKILLSTLIRVFTDSSAS
jgi:exopolysaccharide biosynthesis polyprenyl glycosylphosphotransferase